MGAQTKGNMADPRQRQMTNERMQMRREGARSNQQPSQEQEVGIGNYERKQMQRQQSRVERSSANREQGERRANNTPTPGSGIAFGPGRSSRGDVDLRRLLQDRMTRGN
jgi:hypothetical protein